MMPWRFVRAATGLCLLGWALGGPASGWASCRYFRVSYRLLQCKEAPAAEASAPPAAETDTPELLSEKPEGKLMRVRCSCDYALAGSDPRCDFDRNQELSSLMGAEDGAEPCGPAKAFCDRLCPRALDD